MVLLLAASILPGCYIEGSTCSGPLCVSVGTEIDDDDCGSDCDQRYQCPDADSVKASSLSVLTTARQSASFSCISDNESVSNSLVWNETLFAAADRHARDMAANNFVALSGSDGISIEGRVTALDASLTNVTQLVAGGFANSQALIDEWLRQPEDCAKLLDSRVTEFAMACRYDRNTDFGTYWSLVLATDDGDNAMLGMAR